MLVGASNHSSKNLQHGMRRSVTFYPTSVIVDEDSRPCGKKCLHRMEKYPTPNPNPSNYPHKHPSMDAYQLPLLSQKLKYRSLEKYRVPATGPMEVDR
jgi:hypothetical protein